ncbi:TetR/AcrR family transcriptional regulator [Paenibacillus senegalimassiliensis]|uniref:TetR/AcrR family transcriptional regulator n=1 Tax=Paenibacillus senegalimassiliensis TaxID=1737426 RepID=UPI00073E6140|nr:TetR/AcrR family transcriptional regulator [Paenibacillus senegalimassiliensis]
MRKDAELNRQKILSSVESLIQQQDMDKIGMREIASAAQIGMGTLYRHYPNKSALCMDLVYGNLQHFIDTASEYLGCYQGNPEVALHYILSEYLVFRENNMGLLESVESNWKQGQVFYQSELYSQLVMLLTRVLKPLKPMFSDKELTFTAEMLTAMLKSDIYAFERLHKGLSQEEILSSLIKLLLN